MLLLNKNQSRTNKAGTLISIHLMLLLNVLQGCINIQCGHFNTSYVVIKLLQVHLEHLHRCHFNTSYVVIKHNLKKETVHFKINFNTSYVVIKHGKSTDVTLRLGISIHLMLLLNKNVC